MNEWMLRRQIRNILIEAGCGKNESDCSEDEDKEDLLLDEEDELTAAEKKKAKRTPPRDKLNRGDFLPKKVRDEINSKANESLDQQIDRLIIEAKKKCWDGYAPGCKTGKKTKTSAKTGKTVNNCEPCNEDNRLDERKRKKKRKNKKKSMKDKMRCNSPQRAKSGKKQKKTVKACQNGKEKIIHYGYRGMQDYTQHKDRKRRKSFRARMKCDLASTKKNKLTARHWACKDLW